MILALGRDEKEITLTIIPQNQTAREATTYRYGRDTREEDEPSEEEESTQHKQYTTPTKQQQRFPQEFQMYTPPSSIIGSGSDTQTRPYPTPTTSLNNDADIRQTTFEMSIQNMFQHNIQQMQTTLENILHQTLQRNNQQPIHQGEKGGPRNTTNIKNNHQGHQAIPNTWNHIPDLTKRDEITTDTEICNNTVPPPQKEYSQDYHDKTIPHPKGKRTMTQIDDRGTPKKTRTIIESDATQHSTEENTASLTQDTNEIPQQQNEHTLQTQITTDRRNQSTNGQNHTTYSPQAPPTKGGGDEQSGDSNTHITKPYKNHQNSCFISTLMRLLHITPGPLGNGKWGKLLQAFRTENTTSNWTTLLQQMRHDHMWTGQQDDPLSLLEKMALEDTHLMECLANTMTTRYMCSRCEQSSQPRKATYLSIPLTPPTPNRTQNISLQDLLDDQYQGVILDRQCDTCPCTTGESHTTAIDSPNGATMFTIGRNTGGGRKNMTPVTLPHDITFAGTTMYLTGIATHTGTSTETGHWTTWLCSQNTWKLCDDDLCTKTTNPHKHTIDTTWATALYTDTPTQEAPDEKTQTPKKQEEHKVCNTTPQTTTTKHKERKNKGDQTEEIQDEDLETYLRTTTESTNTQQQPDTTDRRHSNNVVSNATTQITPTEKQTEYPTTHEFHTPDKHTENRLPLNTQKKRTRSQTWETATALRAWTSTTGRAPTQAMQGSPQERKWGLWLAAVRQHHANSTQDDIWQYLIGCPHLSTYLTRTNANAKYTTDNETKAIRRQATLWESFGATSEKKRQPQNYSKHKRDSAITKRGRGKRKTTQQHHAGKTHHKREPNRLHANKPRHPRGRPRNKPRSSQQQQRRRARNHRYQHRGNPHPTTTHRRITINMSPSPGNASHGLDNSHNTGNT
jgi:hypothetical protein